MYHYFDVDFAEIYGLLEAILLNNLWFWIEHNKANEKCFYDGRYWTFNSVKAFAKLFPYVSERQINSALKRLIEQGILMTGNYNKVAYDRTLWYAFTDFGISIMQKCKMDYAKLSNGYDENVKPIPDINKDINKDNNIYSSEKTNENTKTKNKKFIKPTVEQIEQYCKERNNGVDSQRFYDYYESNGWKVGKNPMKDWKACLRTWERNDFGNKPRKNVETSYDLQEFKQKSLNEKLIYKKKS